jgi:hypothetical protein
LHNEQLLHLKLLIGIDDTDNLESRGTGYIARQLGLGLMENGLIVLENITRHQLLVDDRIPYTSHNSSASLVCNPLADTEKITDFCRQFLVEESATGSDVGLCIAPEKLINSKLIDWGNRAKKEILDMASAYELAQETGISLEGLTGEKTGVIGSLAAVGLRAGGNDGRLLWMRNLRELDGIYIAAELKELLKIDEIKDIKGNTIHPEAKIFAGDWCRPVNMDNKITLLVEEIKDQENYGWQSASKIYIKSISE